MDEFVKSLMENYGAFGIGLLMFLENIFPPIPSEIIMPLAGYQAAQGQMSIYTVILAGTIGTVLGIMPWYYLGYFFGEQRIIRLSERFGRWMTLAPSDVRAADRWFRKYGYLAVFLGRLVPTVRTLISIPAGLAEMPLPAFLLFSTIGSLIWTSFLALSGYLLGQSYELIDEYVGPVSNLIVLSIVVLYVYRVITFKPESRRAPSRAE
ncbi:membrane protein DedA, SNARE-associated domain [Aureimonas altamirensis DSM 21988]|uniref:Membrane protein DedA, SNARE-associated domain n=1 Tax=Aureimonas altamirensis DSM 21988 TaxID=1121026 RepID=A0ABY1IMZ8_9HYPH|nr:DedA family protein [Aureimonas altamirensis]UHD47548.1 DedA family protein [Aureimonas altamirensis]SHJ52059.1 membrane protein DedA, SNARE-associated domain [Aureimonas altamirensis DSM 21988]